MQAVTQAITEIATKAPKIAVEIMTEVTNTVEGNAGRGIADNAVHKTGVPLLKQPTFSWTAKDKYMEMNPLKWREITFS